MILYIIRHGDPIYETDSLTEKGKLQAEAVGKRMLHERIDRIFTSPMGRARMTAQPACRMLNLEYSVEEWAHEIEDERLTTFPDGTKKSISLVPTNYFRENGGIDADCVTAFDSQVIKSTQMKSKLDYIEKHGNEFLERLGYKAEGGVYRILRKNEERIALFCHSALARAWLSVLLHIPINMMWSDFDYAHTGVTVLSFENFDSGRTSPCLLTYSDLSHLYKEGLEVTYKNSRRNF